MDPEHLPILLNAGIGGILLWLYVKQGEVVRDLQSELAEVRQAQWALIVALVGDEVAHEITNRPERDRG